MDGKLIIAALAVAGMAGFVLVSLAKERRQNCLPTVQIRATILSVRREAVSTRGPYGMRNIICHHVTFRTAEGEILELTAPEDTGRLPVGTSGLLTYQGGKCERFDAYEA